MPRILTKRGITMALPVCTHCEQYEGVLMVTTLTDGDTQVICPNDILLYAITLAATLTTDMTKAQADMYAEQLDAIYAHDPRAIARPAAKRTAKAKQPPPPDVPPDSSERPVGETVALVPPCSSCGGTTATGDALKLVCNECGSVIATEPE